LRGCIICWPRRGQRNHDGREIININGIINQKKKMKAKVNEEFCTGCGCCEATCPEVFKIHDSVCKVLVDAIPAEALDRCHESMVECPVEAILMER
jgi:ferredoxin